MTEKNQTENSKRADSRPSTKIGKNLVEPTQTGRNNYLLTTSNNFLKYSEPEFSDYLTYL